MNENIIQLIVPKSSIYVSVAWQDRTFQLYLMMTLFRTQNQTDWNWRSNKICKFTELFVNVFVLDESVNIVYESSFTRKPFFDIKIHFQSNSTDYYLLLFVESSNFQHLVTLHYISCSVSLSIISASYVALRPMIPTHFTDNTYLSDAFTSPVYVLT